MQLQITHVLSVEDHGSTLPLGDASGGSLLPCLH